MNKSVVVYLRKKINDINEVFNDTTFSEAYTWFWIGIYLQSMEQIINESYFLNGISKNQYQLLFRWYAKYKRCVHDEILKHM